MIKTYTIPEEFDNKPLMEFLENQGYSGSMLRKMVHQGGISVNEKFHRNIDPVAKGDRIIVDFPETSPVLTANGNLKVPIIYENDDFIIFDKPDDMLVHPAAKDFDDALGNYFAFLYPNLPFRPLGRLDRHTTGLCFIAKNRLTAVTMNHQIEKEYIALAQGEVLPENGKIIAPLMRVNGSIIKRIVDSNGKYAETHYWTLKKHKNYTLLKLKILTGRTHQIRVHLSHIGHPLAGDVLYGGSLDLLKRQGLHCSTMRFFWNGEEKEIKSPLPLDMECSLNMLNKDRK